MNKSYELLIGNNIILRKARPDDYRAMFYNIWNDEDIFKWMLFEPTYDLKGAIERNKRSMEYQRDNYAYYVALKSTDEPIGFCGIIEYKPDCYDECGICIGKKYQGKGYGKELLSLLLDLAFNKLNGKEFQYSYFEENERSKRVAESFGFQFVNSSPFTRRWDQKEMTICRMRLTKEEYNKKGSE